MVAASARVPKYPNRGYARRDLSGCFADAGSTPAGSTIFSFVRGWSSGHDAGLWTRRWGFDSLTPIQLFRRRGNKLCCRFGP